MKKNSLVEHNKGPCPANKKSELSADKVNAVNDDDMNGDKDDLVIASELCSQEIVLSKASKEMDESEKRKETSTQSMRILTAR